MCWESWKRSERRAESICVPSAEGFLEVSCVMRRDCCSSSLRCGNGGVYMLSLLLFGSMAVSLFV